MIWIVSIAAAASTGWALYLYAVNRTLDRNVCELARATKLRNIASPAIIGFCHFLTRRVHVEASDEYISQIVTGAGLESGDPAMVVRNRLIGMGKATRAIKAEIILHGWNAYRRGLKRTIAKSVGHLPDLI